MSIVYCVLYSVHWGPICTVCVRTALERKKTSNDIVWDCLWWKKRVYQSHSDQVVGWCRSECASRRWYQSSRCQSTTTTSSNIKRHCGGLVMMETRVSNHMVMKSFDGVDQSSRWDSKVDSGCKGNATTSSSTKRHCGSLFVMETRAYRSHSDEVVGWCRSECASRRRHLSSGCKSSATTSSNIKRHC